jgi:predicted nucleic acid-binding protein
MALAASGGVLAVQSLLEFVAVVRRKRPQSLASALAKVDAWSEVFETAPTTRRVAADAIDLVRNLNFQVWDAVIWAALAQAGAGIFFTEDLQDGFVHGTLRARNPFALTSKDLECLFEG